MGRKRMNSWPSCIRSDGWARCAISLMRCCTSRASLRHRRDPACRRRTERRPLGRNTAMPIVTIQVTREGTTPGAAFVTQEQRGGPDQGSKPIASRCSLQAARGDLHRYRGGRDGELGLRRIPGRRVSKEARQRLIAPKPLGVQTCQRDRLVLQRGRKT
jgi:hypothetical protein